MRSSAVQSFKQDQVGIYHTFFETFLFEMFKEALGVLRCDPKVHGLHSLRSGGITLVVNNDDSKIVSERLLKMHGRWKTDVAKDMYFKEADSSRLSVSLSLGL